MSVKRAVDGRRDFSHGGCGVGGLAATENYCGVAAMCLASSVC